MATNGIDKVQSTNLTEVKGFKKPKSGLLKKVLLGLGGILLAVSLMCNLKCCTANLDCDKDKDLEPDTKIEASVDGAYKPSTTTKPSTNDQVNNNNNNQNQNNNNNNQNNQNNNNNGQGGQTTTPTTPEEVVDSWVTETLPEDEKITFEDYEEAEEKEDNLTNAQKEYIQEYVDYYNISWEDAMVTYFAYGPLDLSFCNENTQVEEKVEYGTRYVFDADDIASINALVTELGMSKSEAEEYYVSVIAPSLGKTIATESYVLTK